MDSLYQVTRQRQDVKTRNEYLSFTEGRWCVMKQLKDFKFILILIVICLFLCLLLKLT